MAGRPAPGDVATGPPLRLGEKPGGAERTGGDEGTIEDRPAGLGEAPGAKFDVERCGMELPRDGGEATGGFAISPRDMAGRERVSTREAGVEGVPRFGVAGATVEGAGRSERCGGCEAPRLGASYRCGDAGVERVWIRLGEVAARAGESTSCGTVRGGRVAIGSSRLGLRVEEVEGEGD
jgi:hypothetical protein